MHIRTPVFVLKFVRNLRLEQALIETIHHPIEVTISPAVQRKARAHKGTKPRAACTLGEGRADPAQYRKAFGIRPSRARQELNRHIQALTTGLGRRAAIKLEGHPKPLRRSYARTLAPKDAKN